MLRTAAERLEFGTILLVLLLTGSVWTFIELADQVAEGETAAIDRALLLALRARDDPADPLGPPWLEAMARDMTALGSVLVLSLLTLIVTGFLTLRRMWRAALLLLAASGGGMLVSTLLKEVYERPRPDLVPHGAHVLTASFPSGHSMTSAAVYLTLGALLARVESQFRLKLFLLGVPVLLSLMVGVSRVYLGVHWPTDVLGGWTMGAAWALLLWLVARWLQRRGRIRSTRPEPD